MLLNSNPWIVDLGSTNGTLVDGDAVRRERLQEGAVVVVGRSRLRLRAARKGDALLPRNLAKDWLPSDQGSQLSRQERMRRVAGAQSCAWLEGAHPMFHWEENGTWEDLGPVRKHLLQELSS